MFGGYHSQWQRVLGPALGRQSDHCQSERRVLRVSTSSDNPLGLEICDSVRDARGAVPVVNSAKTSRDEMRHKLLQISSRGVQIPCTGRYLNSFRGVCGIL